MQVEWKSVLAAKGYEGHFADWALKWPEIPHIIVLPPQSTELYDLVQIVEHDANTGVV